MNIQGTLQSVRVLIVEDNAAFASLINLLLHEMGITTIDIGQNFQKGLELFQLQQPDICLLDINLGKGEPTGIQLAKEIRRHDVSVPIIYLTSNYTDEYYEQARQTQPSSFLNKELSKLKLFQAIDLALMQLEAKNTTESHKALQTPNPHNITYFSAAQTEHLFFKIGDNFKRIHVDDVAFFYSKDKLTYARVGNRNFPTSVQLKVLEDELGVHFVRIHKGYLVNIQYINTIHPGESNVQIGTEVLPVGHVYRKPFLERLKLLK